MNYRIVCNTPVTENNATVYRDYTLFDLTQEGRELASAVLTRQFNGNLQDGNLTFTIYPGHPCYDCIQLFLSTITVFDGDTEIFRGRPISCKTDRVLKRTYTVEHMMKFFIDVPDVWSTIDDDGNVDIHDAIPAMLTGYNNYAADNRKIHAPSSIAITGKASATKGSSVYSNLSAWLKTAGYYAKIVWNNNRYELSFATDTGANKTDFRVVFGENVLDYMETVNLDKLYTAVYPVGIDSGNDSFTPITMNTTTGVTTETNYPIDTTRKIIYNESVSAECGLVILYAEIDLKDESTKTIQTVYTKAVQALKNASGAKTTFTISAVDPRLVGMGGSVPFEGNYYPVDITPLNITVPQKLTKIVTNMTKPSGGSLTFGGDTNLLTDQSAKSIITAQQAVSDAKQAVSISKTAINKAVSPFVIDATITSTTLTSAKKVGQLIDAINAGKTILVSTGTATYNASGSYASGYTVSVSIPETGNTYTGTNLSLTDTLSLTKV